MTHLGPWPYSRDELNELVALAIEHSSLGTDYKFALRAIFNLGVIRDSGKAGYIYIDNSNADHRCESIPNGPLPVLARYTNQRTSEYEGEYLFWVNDGAIDAIEYAWVTDAPPTSWPGKDAIKFEATDASQS